MNLEQIIKQNEKAFSSVFSFSLDSKKCYQLDLSVENQELKSIDLFSVKELGDYIQMKIEEHNAEIAWGGYAEDRMIYQKSAHFGNGDDARTIHLGIDVWLPAGTELYAPCQSRVHSFKNNQQFGDYGPTIILEHHLEDITFFTLYGHLSKSSLKNLKPGQVFNQGQAFAALGDESENGNWPPHLHFQLINNMGDYTGDFPGVASKNEKEKMLSICPNPTTLLNL